jgi:hypothetical protein
MASRRYGVPGSMSEETLPPDPSSGPGTSEVAHDEGMDPLEAPTPARPDRGRSVAVGAMGVLVLVGCVLIARSVGSDGPGKDAPSLVTGASLTGAHVAGDDAEPTAKAAPAEPETPPPPPVWRAASMKGDPSIDVVEGTFGKHSFAAAMANRGVSPTEARALAAAFEGVRKIEHPGTKETFVIAKSRESGKVVAFEIASSPKEVWQARAEEEAGGRLIARKLALHIERRPVSAGFAVTTDVASAIAASGLREEIATRVSDALESHVEASVLRPGARFRVVASEEWVEGAFVESRLEAVELTPRGGQPLRVYYYERDPSVQGSHRTLPVAGFYDAKSQMPFRGAFRAPIPLAPVTSRFNPKRKHPVLKKVMPHNGVDFGASTGTPVYASGAGTVTRVGPSGPSGNMVEISHPGGITTAYCHLSKFAPGLRSGQRVEGRQVVGYVGQTGRVTGPHLHFAVKRKGVFVDPMSLKLDGVRVLPPIDREVFAKMRADLDAVLDAIPLPPPAGGPEPKDEPESEDHDLHLDE